MNSHDGGATLLKYPERIRRIVARTRELVPHEIPVTMKMRVGWDSSEGIETIAAAAEAGGAAWITVANSLAVSAQLALPDWVRVATSLVLLVLGLAVPVLAWAGWAASERALRLGRPLPGSIVTLPLAVGVLVVAALVVVGVLVR